MYMSYVLAYTSISAQYMHSTCSSKTIATSGTADHDDHMSDY